LRGFKAILVVLALSSTVPVSAEAASLPIATDVVSFVNLFHICSLKEYRSKAAQRKLGCDEIERDRANLLSRYRDQPKNIAMILHPDAVRMVGFIGVEQHSKPRAPSLNLRRSIIPRNPGSRRIGQLICDTYYY
jgi:hypothetical protein